MGSDPHISPPYQTGPADALTDIAGLRVGHYTDPTAASGVTVIVAPDGAVGAVDVRGAAPGTRETDLLQPENLVDRVQAVALCGGSVYGLAAVDGVVRWLGDHGWGFPLEEGRVAPIVPAAVLYDLGRGESFIPPISPRWGRAACQAASESPPEMGCAGAGTGARCGELKGGLGTASQALPGGIHVGALAVVNAYGSVVNPASGTLWEARMGLGPEFDPLSARRVILPPAPAPQADALPQGGGNTTLAVVATDAVLDKAQALKVAQMAHDGLARAIRPAHTMFDGDTIFCLASGRRALPITPGFFSGATARALSEVGQSAADCLVRAILKGVLAATSMAGLTAFTDLPLRNTTAHGEGE
jgi:L-aminopeptidase/D-esterase-like protein